MGGMATRTENTEQAVSLVKQEIMRMGKEGPSAEELASAKEFLIGNYPLRFDSSSKISRQLVALQEENLGIDYFDKRNSYIESVTLDEAKSRSQAPDGSKPPLDGDGRQADAPCGAWYRSQSARFRSQ